MIKKYKTKKTREIGTKSLWTPRGERKRKNVIERMLVIKGTNGGGGPLKKTLRSLSLRLEKQQTKNLSFFFFLKKKY